MNETINKTETMEVTNVTVEIPQISGEEAIKLMMADKPSLTVNRLEFTLKVQLSCQEEMYYFVGGLFRTYPKMNAYPTGTSAADRKTAIRNPFENKIVKYSRSAGRTNFDWATVKGNAEKRNDMELSEIKKRQWGTKIGDTSIVAHTIVGTDITKGYISYNPQRFFESYYVWAETGKQLTSDEKAELKNYLPEVEYGPAAYRNYAVNTVLWLNTKGKRLIVTENVMQTDKEYLAAYLAEKDQIKSARAKKTPPKL